MASDDERVRGNPIGPTGKAVAANIKRLRGNEISLRELAHRVRVYGHPISTSSLQKIESMKRRVDTDDLVAIAKALDVSPITLLMPHVPDENQWVRVSGTPQQITAYELWYWLRGERRPWSGPDGDDAGDWFQIRSEPTWYQAQRRARAWIAAQHGPNGGPVIEELSAEQREQARRGVD